MIPKEPNPIELEELGARIRRDIDDYCAKIFQEDHRTHLGASIIGHDCAAHIWYAFRWAKTQIFDGRMLRLFDRGHQEEHRFIRWLTGIGFTIWNVDENGEQFRITGAFGHFGGSSDSVGLPPYEILNEPCLIEYKTHNAGSFSHLLKNGLILGKPVHWAQMCSYGAKFKLKYGIYVATSKNDDDIKVYVHKLDWTNALDLEKKAEDIIFSEFRPQRISLQSEYMDCKMCTFSRICHDGAPPEKNCRSCTMAQPIENKEWFCHRYQLRIPSKAIPLGCDHWSPIK